MWTEISRRFLLGKLSTKSSGGISYMRLQGCGGQRVTPEPVSKLRWVTSQPHLCKEGRAARVPGPVGACLSPAVGNPGRVSHPGLNFPLPSASMEWGLWL